MINFLKCLLLFPRDAYADIV
uniref:Uncharacterized protein n=1 Tax=Anguilla anguilla TaxID=7936 RepID=A0A0E9VHG8_ANGAN